MERDYNKEWEKEKETKTTRLIKMDKELFKKFQAKLEREHKSINGFVNEQIRKYLKEN